MGHNSTADLRRRHEEAHGAGPDGQGLLETGRLREARRRFWDEAAVAAGAGDATALAEAALGLGGIWVHEHRGTIERAEVAALQRRALAAVAPGSPLARRLRARLRAEACYAGGDDTSLFSEIDVAYGSGDALVVAEALSLAHHCLLGPHHQRERFALAEQLLAVAPFTGRRIDPLLGLTWRTVDLFLAGDRRAVRSLRELQACLETQRCDALRLVADALEVTLAIRRGDLDDAERRAEAVLHLGTDVGDADALGWYGAQLIAVRWLQGRGAEMIELLVGLDQSETVAESNPAFTAALAALAATAQDPIMARSALARLRASDLSRLRPSSVWLTVMSGACEAAYLLGDADTARQVYGLLLPFAQLPVMASLGVACFGSAHRPLGLAASTLGDHDAAVAHLEAAVLADLALDNRPWHAMDLAALGDALERRGATGDLPAARRRWAQAADAAMRCGMGQRAARWLNASRGRPVSTAASHPRLRPAANDDATDLAQVTCVREGRRWLVSTGDRAARVPHSVGMGYLARLVAQPGDGLRAVELAAGVGLPGSHDSAQRVLDPQAMACFRRRVVELQAELDRADVRGDAVRSASLRDELDALLDELRRCTGLGGRSRAFADSPERARTSVQKALRRAVNAIRAEDAELARIIEDRLVTGAMCTFHRPDELHVSRRVS